MDFRHKSFRDLTTKELYEILKSRSEIFVMEQNIMYLDMDDIDYDSIHFYIWEGNRVVAYLRAYFIDDNTIKLGRVLSIKHGVGLGSMLMDSTLEIIKREFKNKRIEIHAQKHAISFYLKFGFKVTSEEFMEEGVPHVTMELKN